MDGRAAEAHLRPEEKSDKRRRQIAEDAAPHSETRTKRLKGEEGLAAAEESSSSSEDEEEEAAAEEVISSDDDDLLSVRSCNAWACYCHHLARV